MTSSERPKIPIKRVRVESKSRGSYHPWEGQKKLIKMLVASPLFNNKYLEIDEGGKQTYVLAAAFSLFNKSVDRNHRIYFLPTAVFSKSGNSAQKLDEISLMFTIKDSGNFTKETQNIVYAFLYQLKEQFNFTGLGIDLMLDGDLDGEFNPEVLDYLVVPSTAL